MNIARLFSYTQQLEKQLAEEKEARSRDRHEFVAKQNKWEEKEKLLIDKLLEKQGQRAVFDPKPPIVQQAQTPMKLPSIAAKERALAEAKRLEINSIKTPDEIREAAKSYTS